ncbi:MICOS complex subunit MIC26, partial [Astyanax mexicanus]
VGGVAGISAGLGLRSALVLAAGKEPSEEISVEENLHYVEPEKGQVEEGVAMLRQLAEPYTTWSQVHTHTHTPGASRVCAADSYEYLKNPPPEFYPRAGVIGFTGIIGLFLARGSRLKKLIYPAGLMAVGASLYYPQEAAAIVKNSGDAMYDWALQTYVTVEKLIKGKPAEKSGKAEEKPTSGSAKD